MRQCCFASFFSTLTKCAEIYSNINWTSKRAQKTCKPLTQIKNVQRLLRSNEMRFRCSPTSGSKFTFHPSPFVATGTLMAVRCPFLFDLQPLLILLFPVYFRHFVCSSTFCVKFFVSLILIKTFHDPCTKSCSTATPTARFLCKLNI